jgi:hypothetical protein
MPWLPWQRPPFWICSTPKAGTYYGGYSYKGDYNMAPKPWISIPNIKIYLQTKYRLNRRICVFWPPFWIRNGRHSKSTMDINSQHHNLLGSQISPKSEDFCIWRPFWILVSMVTAAILNFFQPPKKLPHTTVEIPTNVHEAWLKESKFVLNHPFFVSMATTAKFVQPISIFFTYLVPLDVYVVPIKVHQFLFGE